MLLFLLLFGVGCSDLLVLLGLKVIVVGLEGEVLFAAWNTLWLCDLFWVCLFAGGYSVQHLSYSVSAKDSFFLSLLNRGNKCIIEKRENVPVTS